MNEPNKRDTEKITNNEGAKVLAEVFFFYDNFFFLYNFFYILY
jgi:hypothetical protein